MADTLNIKISVEQTGGQSENDTSVKSKQAKDNAKTAFKVNKAMQVAKQLALQTANGAIGQIGLNTGNYVLQEQMQTALSVVQKSVSVAVAFAANPALGAVALVSEGINLAFEVAAKRREIAWQNVEANELARRAGYLTNGNR